MITSILVFFVFCFFVFYFLFLFFNANYTELSLTNYDDECYDYDDDRVDYDNSYSDLRLFEFLVLTNPPKHQSL